MRIRFVLATPLVLGALALQAQTPAPPKRPMTFLDVQLAEGGSETKP